MAHVRVLVVAALLGVAYTQGKGNSGRGDQMGGGTQGQNNQMPGTGQNSGGSNDNGPPECMTDCAGIDDAEQDVCAYIETAKEDACMSDCPNGTYNQLYGVFQCNLPPDQRDHDDHDHDDNDPPECMTDCAGIDDTEQDVCAYIETVKEDACMSDCPNGTYNQLKGQFQCNLPPDQRDHDDHDHDDDDNGPPECMTDCAGVENVTDVCAFIETIRDDACVSDCPAGFLETEEKDQRCAERREVEARRQQKEEAKAAAEQRKLEKERAKEEKRARLEAARQERAALRANMTGKVSDPKQRRRAEIAAAALENNTTLTKVKTAIPAANETEACAQLCTYMALSDCDQMFCEANVTLSRRLTRRLLSASYETTGTVSSDAVDTTAVEQTLTNAGLTYAEETAEPATELSSIDGIDSSDVQSLVEQTQTVAQEEQSYNLATEELQQAESEVATTTSELESATQELQMIQDEVDDAADDAADDGNPAHVLLGTTAAALAAALVLIA